MPAETAEKQRRVLIAGGGVAALEAMLALRAKTGGRVGVTLVTPDEEFVYRPLATGEPFELGEVTRYSLARLASEHSAKLITGRVKSVDADARRVDTSDGQVLPYDDLILALGLSRDVAFPEALTFHDERDIPGYRELLKQLLEGRIRRIGFVVPNGIVWPFPLYELALMTADFAREHELDVELSLVTPADAPLSLFGEDAKVAMSGMLDERGIRVYAGNQARITAPTRALLSPDGNVVHADRFVALPRLHGPRLSGVPHDTNGFIATDEHGRVIGVAHIYAAGDCTAFPFKQGGLATQQADVVAGTIAAELGFGEAPAFQPVLRGMLLTGAGPRFLRTESVEGHTGSTIADHALWWPPTKIAGRYLAPCLGVLDIEQELARMTAPKVGTPIEVRLERPAAPSDGDRESVGGEGQLLDFPPHGRGL